MTGKRLCCFAFLALVCSGIFLTGCSSQGQPAPYAEINSPEEAVARIFAQWRASAGPSFRLDESGTPLAQETSTDHSESQGYIHFRDLSGETWILFVEKVEYDTPDSAKVFTNYYNSGSSQFGGLKIVFNMIRDEGDWYLNGLDVTEIPAVVVVGTGINGAVTDQVSGLPVGGARVEAYNSSDNQLAGYAVTDSGGYYEILDLAPGTYYLVISRDGYEPYTIDGIQVS